MFEAFRTLVKRFAGPKKICRCETAYLDPSNDNGAGSCRDGRCDSHHQAAVEWVSQAAILALGIQKPEPPRRWLVEEILKPTYNVAGGPSEYMGVLMDREAKHLTIPVSLICEFKRIPRSEVTAMLWGLTGSRTPTAAQTHTAIEFLESFGVKVEP